MKIILDIMTNMKKIIALVIALILAEVANRTVAQSTIKIVDGDSLELNNRRIRLFGIDAPEYMQSCEDLKGKSYMCGQSARAFLLDLIEKGHERGDKLKCSVEGIDQYKRSLSICKMGKVELNLEMVKSGYAVSYKSDMYRDLEKRAKQSRKGIWQGKFMRPELYRALERTKEKEKN